MTKPSKTESTPTDTASGKSKAAKTKETISFLSTAVPLLGLIGTAFVWAAANFYVGTVDVKPADDYQEITIQVFDQKGGEKEFHTPHFLIEPGKYHMSINLDKKGAQHVDAEVKLGATSVIRVAAAPKPAESDKDTDKDGRKHWWQIWKKSNDKTEASKEPSATVEKPGASNSDSNQQTQNTEK
ncbi:MAG: hypothetical protein EKK48_30725 [Candidatus Melainabacteria bacterium]|nr:MAG: hypothetical protein EKK48_30725 [Candidatus Melainabacteria bacterium]